MSYSGGCPRSGSKRDGAKSFKQSKWNEKNVLIWRTFFFWKSTYMHIRRCCKMCIVMCRQFLSLWSPWNGKWAFIGIRIQEKNYENPQKILMMSLGNLRRVWSTFSSLLCVPRSVLSRWMAGETTTTKKRHESGEKMMLVRYQSIYMIKGFL